MCEGTTIKPAILKKRIMKNKMKIKRLRIFVEALNALPIEIKNNEVDMNCGAEPTCGTVGCHAGLVYLVADYIPKLKSLYPQGCDYDFSKWADVLEEFLGFDDKFGYGLRDWACDNPNLWGNDWGYGMFTSRKAFGEKTNNFKHLVIIKKWTEVLERVENKTGK